MVPEAKVQQDSDMSRFSSCEQQEQPDTDEFHQQVGFPVNCEGKWRTSSCLLLGREGGGLEAQ